MNDIWKYIIKFLQCGTEISQCPQEKEQHPMHLCFFQGGDTSGQPQVHQPSAKNMGFQKSLSRVALCIGKG